nr:BTAD domain-containing putative transcriptional regulator [Kutzneria buriramensis]
MDINRHQQRCVLTALLVDANKLVTVDTLADRVWGNRLPQRPRESLYSYLSQLRAALSDADDVNIAQRSGGYQLSVDPESVDLHRFHELVAAARAADDGRAEGLLAEALALWTGDAFAGLDTEWVAGLRETLHGQRHAARLDLTDVRLRAGADSELVAELTELAAAHPLDERLAGQLMLALYRNGRQQDALRHYERIRRSLADELGVDPSPELRQRFQDILDGGTAPSRPVQTSLVPQQLPGAPAMFVGRGREIDRLDALLRDGDGSVVISAIGGTGGVGKTWLALRWAHLNADRFPDGRLYVNLRGFDPTAEPTPPNAALRSLLEGLGVDPAGIPADQDARTALYRSLVAGKKLLILVDNAADAAQVVPLLPGGSTCTVLITSRDRLAGLVTTHGAHPLSLDVFSDADARALLAARLGAGRVDAEPEAVAELLACCAGLPLALSIVAGRALAHPDFPLAVLAAELRDATARLGALDDSDPAASVRAVLACSVAALTTEQARVFSLLGLAPGPDISLPAAASLVGTSIGRAAATLTALEGVSLLQQRSPGRYRMHDLVRLYACEQVGAGQEAALRRVIDFYLHTAATADRLINPHRQAIALDPPVAGCEPARPNDALAWFDAEYPGLLAAQELAVQHGWHAQVWQLTWAASTYRIRRGHLRDDLDTALVALAAAQRLDDPAALAQSHRLLGHAYGRAGEHAKGIAHLRQTLALAEAAADLPVQAYTHHTLAQAWERQGDHAEALEHAIRGGALFQELGLAAWHARALNQRGWLLAQLGQHEGALAACEQALALVRAHDDRDTEASILDSLGFIAHGCGRYAEAVTYYEQSLAIADELGHTFYRASTLEKIGGTHAALGDDRRARTAWEAALDLYRRQNRLDDAVRLRTRLADDR